MTRKGRAVAATALPILIGLVFALLVGKHFEIGFGTIDRWAQKAGNAVVIAGERSGLINACGNEEFTAFSWTVYVCSNPESELAYDYIYNTYPASGEGREVIYSFLDNGSRERADEMLRDIHYIERYEPVALEGLPTWTEDPFGERYWRFLFYSLRPMRHLLDTALDTNAEPYFDKTRALLSSFVEDGMDKPHAWDDAHGAAFRTMMLTNAWWKLREAGELPSDLSDKMLAALELHGEFLHDPENYEGDYNHGVTQAAALLALAVSFPDFEHAPLWRETALERLETGLREVVDEDGVLVENSPYYHLYTLEKYWEIYKYVNEQDVDVASDFNETVEKMVAHATYVLQPDLNVPLLGASIPRTIGRTGEFREMAEDNPAFDYVVTQGTSGTPPEELNVLYPSSGIAILRSGWGKERPYDEEAQALFDTGPYRTDHSDFDALTISFYAAGAPIVRDAGLFTYEADHPLYDYFHGTRGHNTVMVDGTDQPHGTGETEAIQAGEGFAYVSARHDLYPGVRHNRAVMLIEDGALLVVDDIESEGTHRYEQLFHLNPDARITGETPQRLEGVVDGGSPIPFSITQLEGSSIRTVWHGDEESRRGLCATAYEVLAPCAEVAYEIESAERARFVTLVQAGSGTAYEATYADGVVTITTSQRSYIIHLTYPDSGQEARFIQLSVDTDIIDNPNASIWDRIRGFFSRFL